MWPGTEAPPRPYSRGFPARGDGLQGLPRWVRPVLDPQGLPCQARPVFLTMQFSSAFSCAAVPAVRALKFQASGHRVLCLARALTSLEGHLMQMGR